MEHKKIVCSYYFVEAIMIIILCSYLPEKFHNTSNFVLQQVLQLLPGTGGFQPQDKEVKRVDQPQLCHATEEMITSLGKGRTSELSFGASQEIEVNEARMRAWSS